MLKKIKAEKLRKQDNVNQNRRKFLKIILFGSGVLLTERVLGPLYSRFFSDSSDKNPTRTNSLKTNSFNKINTDSGNFSVVRNKDGLSIYDATGEEIFQIDNGV